MGSVKDMTSMVFGRWTVLHRTTRPEHYKSFDVFWMCECECGSRKPVSGKSLRTGDSKSCGCLARETSARNGRDSSKDISRETFGYWTVLRRSDNPSKKNPNWISGRWVCKCRCGTIKEVFGGSLTNGNSQSCGCFAVEAAKNRRVDQPTASMAHGYVKTERGPASGYTCVSCIEHATQWAYNHLDPNEHVEETYVDGVLRRRYYYSSDSNYYDPKCNKCNSSDIRTIGQLSSNEKYAVKP